MRRNNNEYRELTEVIFDIYRDYGFGVFPIDVELVCKKMGVSLLPYSAFNEETQVLLMRRSNYGFFVKETREKPPTIFYNGNFGSPGAIRLTIMHEIKHYVFDEDSKDESTDDLATFFARYFLCPIPYLIEKGIEKEGDIVSRFGVSMEAAKNVSSNVKNRKLRSGNKIFKHEEAFLRLIDDKSFERFIRLQSGEEVKASVLVRL